MVNGTLSWNYYRVNHKIHFSSLEKNKYVFLRDRNLQAAQMYACSGRVGTGSELDATAAAQELWDEKPGFALYQ
jgi:hypothetical protein